MLGNEGEEDGREREARNEKSLYAVQKGSAGKIKDEISRRNARSMGKYRTKQGKIEVGAEKSDVPSKNRRKLDSKWENGKENSR